MRKLLLAFAMWFALSGLAMAAVNINTATKEELTSLKALAKNVHRILSITGPRTVISNRWMIWKKFRVIGPGLMKQMRPQVTTTGKTVDQPADKGSKTKASDSAKSTKSSESKKSESAKTDSPKADAKAERAKEKTAEKSKAADRK